MPYYNPGDRLRATVELAVEALVTQMPVRFHPSDDDPWLNAVLITATQPRRADSIEQLLIPAT